MRSDHTVVLTAAASSSIIQTRSGGCAFTTSNTTDARLPDQQLRPAGTHHRALYKSRWQVELFFKWIKQHLRIKAFYGTSENAVKTQIWIAISVYVLVAIVKKRLAMDATLYQILQVLSVTLFEKTPILQAFDDLTPKKNQADFLTN